MRCQLRDVCGVRSGDKGDISDISLFADDRATYDALVAEVTPALKFVLHDALGGGVTMSLRSDTQGKTHGVSLLRMWIDLPDDTVLSRRSFDAAR
jgi:hypothetical protein